MHHGMICLVIYRSGSFVSTWMICASFVIHNPLCALLYCVALMTYGKKEPESMLLQVIFAAFACELVAPKVTTGS